MSGMDSDLKVEDDWEDIDRWATEAVRGANNWLVTIRNATDEGIEPWSDEFTNGDGGIMTYSEGLTALSITHSYASGHSDWETLRPRLYEEDLKYIVDKITEGEKSQYTPEPYFSDELTSDFTDAVSFSTSALADSLVAGIEVGDVVTEEEIQKAVRTNLEWTLKNKIDTGENACGWGWVGSESEDYNEARDEPLNYFTYAVVLPLCDLLARRNDDIIGPAVANLTDEIRDVLEGAKNFLLNEYWEGTHWTGPTFAEDVHEEMSTCYTIVALSYIDEVADGVNLDDQERMKIAEGLNYFVSEYKKREQNMWMQKTSYACGSEAEYTDGSAPYLYIDAIYEVINYHEDLIDQTEFTVTELETLINESLARVVLSRCWAGDSHFTQKGFRHLGLPKTVVTQEDGDPENNMTAIYATGVALETFYLNFLGGEDGLVDLGEREANTTESGSDSEVSVSPVEGQTTVENQYNMSFVFAGEGTDTLSDDQKRQDLIVNELEQLFGDGKEENGVPTDILTRSQKFTLSTLQARKSMEESFEGVYSNIEGKLSKDSRKGASKLADEELNQEMKEVNIENFLQALVECYYANDADEFRSVLEYYKNEYWPLALKPQQEAVNSLLSVEEEVASQFEQRAEKVEKLVTEFQNDILIGQDPDNVGHELNNRDQWN